MWLGTRSQKASRSDSRRRTGFNSCSAGKLLKIVASKFFAAFALLIQMISDSSLEEMIQLKMCASIKYIQVWNNEWRGFLKQRSIRTVILQVVDDMGRHIVFLLDLVRLWALVLVPHSQLLLLLLLLMMQQHCERLGSEFLLVAFLLSKWILLTPKAKARLARFGGGGAAAPAPAAAAPDAYKPSEAAPATAAPAAPVATAAPAAPAPVPEGPVIRWYFDPKECYDWKN